MSEDALIDPVPQHDYFHQWDSRVNPAVCVKCGMTAAQHSERDHPSCTNCKPTDTPEEREMPITPGPWRAHGKGFRPDTENGGKFVPILGANGEWVADVRTPADANAIIALPDLLAACCKFAACINDGQPASTQNVLHDAEQAIAKSGQVMHHQPDGPSEVRAALTAEQRARDVWECRGVGAGVGEIVGRIAAAIRAAELDAYRRGQEEMRQRCANAALTWHLQISRPPDARNLYEAIAVLPITDPRADDVKG